jgi:DNA-binding response OmpR family regulator
MKILLAEDDPQLGKAVRTGLEQLGHAVNWVQDGVAAELAAADGDYSAIVLDLGLPRQDGMSVLQRVRARGYAGVIVIITARDEVPDRIGGLDAGADDFVVKPFDLGELGARLRAAARRIAGRTANVVSHGELRIDPVARMVTAAGAPVYLTAREFTLLLYLLERVGRVLTRAQLHEALYSWTTDVESNALEVHIHHLRRKLGRELIRTVRGQGYMIAESAAASVVATAAIDPVAAHAPD